MTTILTVELDWYEANGWKCPFCGGEIDHQHEERDKDAGYSDDYYVCQSPIGWMCEQASMMVRWSHTEKGNNGDALTLKRFIEIEADDKYVNDVKPDPFDLIITIPPEDGSDE